VSGYEFRRRPIFAAGFRGRTICMALSRSGSVLLSCSKNGAPLSISVVSSRDGQHAGRCPVRRRRTGVINSCTSRQTVYAVGSGGVVKAHPK